MRARSLAFGGGRCRGNGAGCSLHPHPGPLPEGEGEKKPNSRLEGERKRCRSQARSRRAGGGDSERRLRDTGACVSVAAGPRRRGGRAVRGARGERRPWRLVRMTSASVPGRSRCRACGGAARSGSTLVGRCGSRAGRAARGRRRVGRKSGRGGAGLRYQSCLTNTQPLASIALIRSTRFMA